MIKTRARGLRILSIPLTAVLCYDALMKAMKKTLLITLATLAVAAVLTWALRSYGFRSMSLGLLANFLLMDWVALVSGILGPKVRFYLPRKYYEPQPFEREGRIYRFMGVGCFKRLVARGPLSVLAAVNFHGKRTRLDTTRRPCGGKRYMGPCSWRS